MWPYFVTFNFLLTNSDTLGLLRALGSSILVKCGPSIDLETWYLLSKGNVQSQRRLISLYCTECQLQIVNAENNISNVLTFINNMELDMFNVTWRAQCQKWDQRAKEAFSGFWFDNVTIRMNALTKVRSSLQVVILSELNRLKSQSQETFSSYITVISIVVLVCSVLLMTYIMTIKQLSKSIMTFASKYKLKVLELQTQRKNTERILNLLLPPNVTEQLKISSEVMAQYFDCVTLYFSDIVSFTNLSSKLSPFQVIALLNDLYNTFDKCIGTYDAYKVETVGDAYMVVSGCPKLNGISHAEEICKLSLDLRDRVCQFSSGGLQAGELKLRIGVHTGKCAAGVVGVKMPRYCLFGDSIKLAEQMESNGAEPWPT